MACGVEGKRFVKKNKHNIIGKLKKEEVIVQLEESDSQKPCIIRRNACIQYVDNVRVGLHGDSINRYRPCLQFLDLSRTEN
jgi:hypothetical protein